MNIGRKEEDARRPVSRVLSPLAQGMAIHLGRPSPDASRDRPGRRPRKPAEPSKSKDLPGTPSLLGLAPGVVCPAAAVTGGAVRSYRTISPLPAPKGLGGVFLWHFPWGRPRRVLPGTVFPWSPDFPPSASRRRAAIRPSGIGIRWGGAAEVKPPAPGWWHGAGFRRRPRRRCAMAGNAVEKHARRRRYRRRARW